VSVMGTREATAFAALPLAIAVIALLPPWAYLAAVWLVAMLAARELLAIFHKLGHPVLTTLSLIGVGLGLPAVWLLGLPWGAAVPCVLVAVLPLLYLLGRAPIVGAATGISGSVLTGCYFTVTAGSMGLLRLAFRDPIGWKVVLITCLAIWGGDSGAYYLGSRLGRHKLAPRVSPKKSWEGIVGGTVTTFFAVWLCRTVFFAELPGPPAFGLAALLSVLAPLGDLVESLFKRDANIKDSSGIIPGHGGFLDRTDSLFYVAPFVLALLLATEGLS
jgi:phosphatidate cytidylyltransferase